MQFCASLGGVKGNVRVAAGAFCLAVAPFGLKLLNVRRVEQHYGAKLEVAFVEYIGPSKPWAHSSGSFPEWSM